MRRSIFFFAAMTLAVVICGCNYAPGRPPANYEPLRPSEILTFDTLYQQNCAGCHGDQGRGGAAIALDSPVYLKIADDATIRRVTAQGVPGTAMPAFAQSSGGMLTDEQINAIVAGIRSKFGKHAALDAAPFSYSMAPGDPRHGGSWSAGPGAPGDTASWSSGADSWSSAPDTRPGDPGRDSSWPAGSGGSWESGHRAASGDPGTLTTQAPHRMWTFSRSRCMARSTPPQTS